MMRQPRKERKRLKAVPKDITGFPVHPNAYHIYTDGSMRPTNNAAYAYVIFSERTKHIQALCVRASRHSTINQMELRAIDHALDYPQLQHAVIYTDSMYSLSAVTLWRKTWEKNNWMTASGQPVLNKELIQSICRKLDKLASYRFVKVDAHTGDPFNSLVDYLAQEATSKMRDHPDWPDDRFDRG
jgi:ribonuclease HI